MIITTVYQSACFELSKEEYRKNIRYDLFEEDLAKLSDDLFDYACKNMHPCFGGVLAEVDSYNPDVNPPEVCIDGTYFQGNILEKLHGISVVAPYYVTCGTEFEKYNTERLDPLSDFFIDILKTMVLDKAFEQAANYFAKLFNSKTISSLNPGSGNAEAWNIRDIEKLFEIIDRNGCLKNVSLTSTSLIIPNKSVCGIFYPSETEEFTCSVCTRKNCPRRRIK